ncbi:hypothetical protein HHK36_008061 [Tetracentron sinense]|uniref:Bifunctional inhibitor/plant lipid transfer protein/seed storage helical domain-containing protein n=1 Tax=Tetracentron sinense TaxID=13715 RepID=A0A834ZLR7_TETSI|nr:hypothetical protein HHK36_008061 [Tetracentron sinense]
MVKVLFLLCVLAIWAVATVNCAAPAPAPVVDCSTLIFSMVDCLSFVSNGSKESKPQGNCCSGLKTVLKTDAECICEAFKSSAQLGIVLNVTKASSLPASCGVSAPSISNCGLSITPGAAPAHSPTISKSPVPAPASSGASAISISFAALVGLVASFSYF